MAPPISRRLEVEWSSARIACSVIESTWRLHMASIHFDTRFLLLHRSVEFFRVSLAFYSTPRHSCNRPHRIRIYKRLEIGLLSLLVIRNMANTRSSYKFVRACVCFGSDFVFKACYAWTGRCCRVSFVRFWVNESVIFTSAVEYWSYM